MATKVPYRMGKKLGVGGDGVLQDVFQSSQKSHAYYFSDSVAINMFAKYKPFRNPSGSTGIYVDHFTAADGTPNTTGDRYIAALSMYFGLTPPAKRRTANLIVSNSDQWVYSRPIQGQHPLRALDFEGYDHLSPPPCRKLGDPTTGEIRIAIGQQNTFSFGAYIEHPVSGGDWITWADLPKLDSTANEAIGSYYLCVVFAKNSDFSGDLIAKTSNVDLTNDIVLDLTNNELRNLLSGNYKYYLLCARKNKIQNGTAMAAPGDDTYVALPTKNGISDVMGKFTLSLSNLGNLVIASVSTVQSPTAVGNFTLVTGSGYDYHGAAHSDTDAYYYLVPNPYRIQFGIRVTANDSGSLTLNATQISLSRTFYSDTPIPPQSASLYTASGTTLQPQNTVTVPAGTSQIVYFVTTANLLAMDADGREWSGTAPNAFFTIDVAIYQNGVQLASDQMRVRNYSNIP